ncbi:MAG TPA: NAD(P)H-hydrate epimerase, partial [Tepidisphaeraceae bacterium]
TIDLRAIVSLIHKNDIAVVAVDVPSGMDCDTGAVIANEVIPAGRTVTFVAEKAGFASAAARALTGEIVVGDIGIPPEIIARVTSPSADPR